MWQEHEQGSQIQRDWNELLVSNIQQYKKCPAFS